MNTASETFCPLCWSVGGGRAAVHMESMWKLRANEVNFVVKKKKNLIVLMVPAT